MAKVTDTIRILAGMRGGCTLAHVRKLNHGRFGGFFEHDLLRHPDGRERSINYPAVSAAIADGLIDRGPELDFHRDQADAHLWVLTPAGQTAAASLPQIQLDDLFVVAPATPPEVLAARRNKLLAKQVLRVMTFNGGRIRGSQVSFVAGNGLVAAFASAYREPLSADVMSLITPHCESFTDIDGKQSLRITEAGITATASIVRSK